MMNNIIFEIAKKSDLADNFADIRVLRFPNNCLAFTDTKNKILFLNWDETEILESSVLPLMIHEVGHIDKRLKAPKGLEKTYEFEVRRNPNLKMPLNFVFDMKIHMLYDKIIPQSYSFLLQKFVSEQRNRILERDKRNLILSLSYPTTKEQKLCKKILLNKKLTDLEKAKEILKLFKKKGKGVDVGNLIAETFTETEVILSEEQTKELKKVSTSIKKNIQIAKKKIEEVKDKLVKLGFSAEQIELAIEEVKAEEVEYFVRNLETIRDIFNLSERTYIHIKERKKKQEKPYGKLIAFRRLKDVSELMKNPIDLLLLGNYDINSIRIPKMINNKTKTTNVVIIRDISGSLSGEPENSIIRDIVVGVINLCKRFHFKVGLIEFHSESKVIYSKSKEKISTDYDTLILKSLFNKFGYSTCLSLAIKDLNKIIEEYKLFNENLNVIIVTDTITDEAKQIKCNQDKLKLIILTTEREPNDEFKKFLDLHRNKKMFMINKIKDKKELVLENIF